MMELMLQLAPLRLGLAHLGDVAEDHEKMRELPVLADEQPLAPLEGSYGAVHPDNPVFRHFLNPALQDEFAVGDDGRAIIRMHALHQALEARSNRPGLEPENAIKLVRPLDRAG